MPASEAILSLFIATHGAGSVSKGMMKSWLEGICMWHEINDAPWNGDRILKRVVKGAENFTLPLFNPNVTSS